MNVLYFCSDAFVSVASVSIVSLLDNNKEFDEIIIYVVDDGISEEKKELLNTMIKSYNREIVYLPAPDPSVFFQFPFKSRYQMGHSYVRMCIGSLLSQDIDRVLCLDSDTLILRSLNDLWNLEMGENILAGVADCVNLKAFRYQFMLDDNDIYCNAGMFLVNLKEWRKNDIEGAICRTIKEHNGNIFFFEQTLMNFVCRGKIKRLPPKYNSYTLFYAFTFKNLIRWRRPTNFYKKEEVDEAIKNPYIIHFTRNFYMTSRPWVVECDHPLAKVYIGYKKKTPWSQTEIDKRPISKIIKYKLVRYIPQSILVHIVNIMYNVIRPTMRWKNE